MKFAYNQLLCLLLILTAGCSSYHRTWKAGAQISTDDPVAGRWQGRWESNANGHTGKLRAVIRPTGDDAYVAHYWASYRKVLRFTYDQPFTVQTRETRADGKKIVAFSGKTDLGPLAGGVYTYEGRAEADDFHATYRCRWDHGTYDMRRLRPGIGATSSE
jgi:hypothetical protein